MRADAGPETGGGQRRPLDLAFSATAFLGQLALILMLAVMAIEVVLRTFHLGTLWIADEASANLLVATTFLGLSIAVREGALFRFDGLVSRLSGKTRAIYERLLLLIALATAVVLVFYLSRFVLSTYTRGKVSDGMIDYPLWIPQVLMPIGAVFLVVALVEQILVPSSYQSGAAE